MGIKNLFVMRRCNQLVQCFSSTAFDLPNIHILTPSPRNKLVCFEIGANVMSSTLLTHRTYVSCLHSPKRLALRNAISACGSVSDDRRPNSTPSKE